ncbi:MAG: transcription antitermination factor NusB [Deltaproteobacteria bacterium]|nr:transcription antitermination factor NusB [Deltaproteobacteria bacterium]
MGKRRKSRILVLQLLYQYEIRKEPAAELLTEFCGEHPKLHPDILDYAESIFKETLNHLKEIDGTIEELALHWKINRLSLVDKSILRIAVCEILFRDDIPDKVAVDEAIEMAKQYGGEDSGAFVNGLLDRLIRKSAGTTRRG